MKKSFSQANGDETQTTVGVTQKFIKVRTMKANVVRSSGLQPTGLASHDSLDTGPSKLADHEVAKSLKMLKVSCLCLAIVTVINSATFGGLIPSLVSHLDMLSFSLSLSLSLSLRRNSSVIEQFST